MGGGLTHRASAHSSAAVAAAVASSSAAHYRSARRPLIGLLLSIILYHDTHTHTHTQHTPSMAVYNTCTYIICSMHYARIHDVYVSIIHTAPNISILVTEIHNTYLKLQMSHLPAYLHTYPYIVETVYNDTGFMVMSMTYIEERRKSK